MHLRSIIGYFCVVALLAAFLGLLPPCKAEEVSNRLEGPKFKASPESPPSEQMASTVVRGPFTLEKCIEIGIANNPEVLIGGFDIETFHAEQGVAAGQRWPNLHLKGLYTRSNDPQRLVPGRFNGEMGMFSRDLLGSSLVLRLPLFTGGRIVNEIRAAELFERVARHRLSRTREELVFNLSSVFYTILGQRHVIGSLEFSKRVLKEHHDRVKELISVLKAAPVDQLRIKVRLAGLEERLLSERNRLSIQHQALLNLMGLHDFKGPLDIDGELIVPEERSDFQADLKKALEQRPDYRAALLEVEAQARKVDKARGDFWPQVSLEAAYGGRWAVNPIDPPGDIKDSEAVGSVGIVMDYPLFTGGSIKAGLAREQAKLARAKERLRATRLRVKLELETSLLNVNSAQKRVETQRAAINQGREALRIEREKYDLGKGSILDVLDAQEALLEAETGYYRALVDYHISIAQRRLAVGEEK